MNQTLLSFSIGPVQEFIAAARTTRDLWTGSYLLSWLTAHAMSVVLELPSGRLISPAVSRDHPLLAAVRGRDQACRRDAVGPREQPVSEDALLACLPNAFLAAVSNDGTSDLAARVKEAVDCEWQRIAEEVKGHLDNNWRSLLTHWDARWQDQIDDFWDIRVLVLPGDVENTALDAMFEKPPSADRMRRHAIEKLAAADKLIRHVPSHEVSPPDGQPRGHSARSASSAVPDDTRPKCSLQGSLAQMGPIATGDESQKGMAAQFWKSAQEALSRGQGETRLGSRDRLCAVSLVKRFAWSAALADALGQRKDARHFSDIDTICAAEWLAGLNEHPRLNWRGRHEDKTRSWSGHWLRWETIAQADDEGETEPDREAFEKIKLARSCRHQLAHNRSVGGPPPAYYAIVQLDGDRLGQTIRNVDDKGLAEVSRELDRFSRDCVPEIVRSALGTLVYSGGDDVLAFVPAGRALNCVSRLNTAFRGLHLSREGAGLTCSAAVVLAHYKTPLRLVLAAARWAEQSAKQGGRNCLALSVMRRSGEHSTALIGWDDVATLMTLAEDFRNGASDRWTYRFRRQLDDLPIEEMWQAELKRLLGRAESLPPGFVDRVLDFWDRYRKWSTDSDRPAPKSARATWPLSFIQLVQAVSFLARGGRE